MDRLRECLSPHVCGQTLPMGVSYSHRTCAVGYFFSLRMLLAHLKKNNQTVQISYIWHFHQTYFVFIKRESIRSRNIYTFISFTTEEQAYGTEMSTCQRHVFCFCTSSIASHQLSAQCVRLSIVGYRVLIQDQYKFFSLTFIFF